MKREDLERSVLGTLLIDANISDLTTALLSPDMFSAQNSDVFTTILNLKNEGVRTSYGSSVDLLSVMQDLKKRKRLDYVGGATYLSMLTSFSKPFDIYENHVKAICEQYFRSKMIEAANKIIQLATDESQDIFEAISTSGSILNTLTELTDIRREESKEDVLERTKKEILEKGSTGINGVASGIREVDEVIAGWSNSDLHIIAGRPGQGKTAFALSMADKISLVNGVAGAFFSLEMRSEALYSRLFAIHGNISTSNIWRGNLSGDEWTKVIESSDVINTNPIEVYDKYFRIDDIINKCRSLHRKGKLKYVVIDYLQLIESKGNGNREQEVSQISRRLKMLAMSLNVPVIALSQLSRKVEERADKKPMLSDLRESGSIEQDASTVMFCYRPSYYGITGDSGEDLSDKAFLILGKFRNGSLKDISLKYNHDLNQEWGTKLISIDHNHIDYTQPLKQNTGFDNENPF